MDPLSIIASSLTLVATTGKVLQGLEKAWNLRNREEEFSMIEIQVKGIYSQLQSMELALRNIGEDNSETIQDCKTNVHSRCAEVIQLFSNINVILQNVIPKSKGESGIASRKPSKRKWTQCQQKLSNKIARIAALTISLSATLNTLQGIQTSTNLRIMSTRLDTISLHTLSIQTTNARLQLPLPAETIDNSTTLPESSGTEIETVSNTPPATNTSSPPFDQVIPLGSSIVSPGSSRRSLTESRRSSVASFHTAIEPFKDSIDIAVHGSRQNNILETSISTYQSVSTANSESMTSIFSVRYEPNAETCFPFCKCQCHIMGQYRTPQWAERLIGSIAFYGNGSILLNRRPCNKKLCRRSGSTHMQVSYRAPGWIPTASNVYIRGESLRGFAVCAPRVIPDTHGAWSIIERGNITALRKLLSDKTASPFDVDKGGESLLRYAANWQQTEIYMCLLNENADPYLRASSGQMALQPLLDYALIKGRSCYESSPSSPDLCDMVLTSENLQHQNFGTLHQIVLGLKALELGPQLESDDSDINGTDINGRTPLYWAAWCGNISAVDLLIRFGADVNISDNAGWTPLAAAVGNVHLNIVESLLQAGASVSIADSYGDHAIHRACSHDLDSAEEIVQELVKWGANPNAKNYYLRTPSHVAAQNGNLGIIDLLLAEGAEIDAVDIYGFTPVLEALYYGKDLAFFHLAKAGARLNLIRKTAGVNLVELAVQYGSIAVWQLITEQAERGELGRIVVDAEDILLNLNFPWRWNPRGYHWEELDENEWKEMGIMLRAFGVDISHMVDFDAESDSGSEKSYISLDGDFDAE